MATMAARIAFGARTVSSSIDCEEDGTLRAVLVGMLGASDEKPWR